MVKNLTPKEFKSRSRERYLNKYYALFINLFEFEGLEYRVDDFLMEKLLNNGKIAAFKRNLNHQIEAQVGFSDYTIQGRDLHNLPIKAKLIPTHNSPQVPSKILTVNEEVVILELDFLPKAMIDYYVEIMVDIDSTIRTNLKLHKMPFAVNSLDSRTKKAIQDLLDDETIVSLNVKGIEAITTGTPYIIDKLEKYKLNVEHELLTVLGIDNVKFEKSAQMNVDEINANNDEINAYRTIIKDKLEQFFNKVNEVLGFNISIKEADYIEAINLKDNNPERMTENEKNTE